MAKKMKAHIVYQEDECGNPTDVVIARVHPASRASVEYVLAQDANVEDGRSRFMWIRLSNGDLILGVYPQGDTYLQVEHDAQYPD